MAAEEFGKDFGHHHKGDMSVNLGAAMGQEVIPHKKMAYRFVMEDWMLHIH